jgi:hypothetical protein
MKRILLAAALFGALALTSASPLGAQTPAEPEETARLVDLVEKYITVRQGVRDLLAKIVQNQADAAEAPDLLEKFHVTVPQDQRNQFADLARNAAKTATMVLTSEFFADFATELEKAGSPQAVQYRTERFREPIKAPAKACAAFGVKDVDRDFDELARLQTQIISGAYSAAEVLNFQIEYNQKAAAVIHKCGDQMGKPVTGQTPEERARVTPKRSASR